MPLAKEKRITGRLGDVTLADLIQVLGMNRRTVTLVLSREGEDEGRIFFKDGMVLHAFVGPLEGEGAVLKMIQWTDADFAVEEWPPSIRKVTIGKSSEALMLTTFSKLDETRRQLANRGRSPGLMRARRPAPALLRSMMAEPKPSRSSVPVIAVGLFLVLAVSVYLSVRFSGKSSAPPVNAPSPEGAFEAAGQTPVSDVEPPAVSGSQGVASSPETEAEQQPPGRVHVPPSREQPTPEPASFGYLRAVVEPRADVFIDGRKVGETPLGRMRLRAGAHTITLSNAEFAGVIQDTITIPADGTLNRTYSFNDFGYLQVVVIPWAEISVDGRPVGLTPIGKVKIPVGRHTVAAKHPELGEKQVVAEIRLGETTLIRLEM